MYSYRDIIFLAVDYGKEDIAIRLANLGADLFRKECVRLNFNNMFVMILLNSGWVLDDLPLQTQTHCYLKYVESQNISLFYFYKLYWLSTQNMSSNSSLKIFLIKTKICTCVLLKEFIYLLLVIYMYLNSKFMFQYNRKSKDGDEVTVAMDVIERAATLKMVNLVNVLAKKQIRQREVFTPRVPRRALAKLQLGLSMKSQDFEQTFVTKLPICSY